MTTQEIVSKLWNLCNVLRDDGITYHQYVTELTYILFLKMAKETGTEEQIPEKYRWDELKAKSGVELKKFYKELLSELGDNGTGRIREIYQGAATNIDEPKNLEKIVATIDSLDWYSAREEGLGNLYEGLLEKNANEKKSGAGQYFTPRVLIDVMTKLMKPQVGERCNDPACGTFGFMIAAHQYVAEHTDNFFDIADQPGLRDWLICFFTKGARKETGICLRRLSAGAAVWKEEADIKWSQSRSPRLQFAAGGFCFSMKRGSS